MHRLPLLLCAVALLGSAFSGWLFLRIGNSKQVLEQRLTDATIRATKLDADLASANERNGSLTAQTTALTARATALESDLATAKSKLTAAESRTADLGRDLAQTKEVLALYESTARGLADEVASLREDLEASRTSNASPEAVAAYKSTIAELERQLATARDGAVAPATAGGSTAAFSSSRAGRATVLTVGPDSAFVVLNFGSARGAQLGHKLTIAQGTSIVATVQISDVRANFSVAQVLADTLRGALQKGDSAILVRSP